MVYPFFAFRTRRRWCPRRGMRSRAGHRTRRSGSSEAPQRLLQRHILAGHTRELLCHMEALGQEALHLAGAADSALVFLGQLVHTHDGNDVLQLLVALQHFLHGTGDLVVLLAHDFGDRIRLVESSGSTAG